MVKRVNPKFADYVTRMPLLLEELEGKPFVSKQQLIDIPKQGVYVFYENGQPIYVGRSNRLKNRIQEHSRMSATHNSAPFAFNLAAEVFGRKQKSPLFTREQLGQLPEFNRLFLEAKERVANMQMRIIKIDDQIEQSLFEIYAALELNTGKYNDFGTH